MYPNQLVLVAFHSRRLLCHMPYWALPAKLLVRSAWVDLKIVNKNMPEIIGWCFDFLLIPELFVIFEHAYMANMFELHAHPFIQIHVMLYNIEVLCCTWVFRCGPRRSLRCIEKVCGVWLYAKDIRLETCQDLIIKRLNFRICST